jgi:YjjG family noncanonical pyrimidine nucleotidase
MLDADDTLFDYSAAESVALERAFCDAGLRWAPSILESYRRINSAIWREFERGAMSVDEVKLVRFERLLVEVGASVEAEAFSANYLARLGLCAQLVPGALETVELMAQHAHLLMITNGLQDVQRPRLEAADLARFFDAVIISEEVGASKPDAAIFDAAFQAMGHPAKAEVLIVGDSTTSDMPGGSDYGIDTCWVNRHGRCAPEGIRITYEIASIRELPALLGLTAER